MFADRAEAGRRLAETLQGMTFKRPVVLALPRGGVPVAAKVAEALDAPLGLILVRKIGVPGHEELAAGAVAEGADPVFNPEVLNQIGMKAEDFEGKVTEKRREIAERRQRYLGGAKDPDLRGATAIVVDDGIATGATVRAALSALRDRGADRVVLAVPVAPREARQDFGAAADKIVILQEPIDFYAVGAHYQVFPQTADSEVKDLIAAARARSGDSG
ncbi:phosphoribosyltransferase family protein [Defluviimonas sp. WL0002]|uniref:Phosphoribosyltransferase family protein n=1 Tax=Albidovulum marisflavi TaxID=2984159 RepID=A0ABT2Z7P3_9RHOB|nr:phosphoribosyltransferase family protein [Defluviimonas sp. WL0002]MCV2867126.1 phosphoribosyltransferase family protein [Defluviimonas sp. WL0002]